MDSEELRKAANDIMIHDQLERSHYFKKDRAKACVFNHMKETGHNSIVIEIRKGLGMHFWTTVDFDVRGHQKLDYHFKEIQIR